MAKPKLKSKSGTGSASGTGFDPPKLLDNAREIWMAGIGAFARAQEEGGRLFERLVREGASIEKKTRSFATGRVDGARDAVENTVSQVRERATDTWDRLEKVFEERVSNALTKLGVPGRDDMQALLDRVEELTAEVRRSKAGVGASSASKAPAAKRAAAKNAAVKPAASPPAAKRQARKPKA